MKLKIKTAGLVGIAMGLFILLLFLFIRPLLLNDAKDMDKESLRIDMMRVANYIDSEADDLQRLNLDWAIWDDTYNFIANRNQQYIDSNLTFETFENNAINVLFYFNNDREIIFSEAYDLESRNRLDLSLSRSFIEGQWEELIDSEEALIIDHEEVGAVLTVSQPVFTSNGDGPSPGVLVMGKVLNEGYFEEMKTDLAIDFEVLANEQNTGTLQSVMEIERENTLSDIVSISDNVALEVYKERKYYNEKLKSLNDLFLALSLATLFLLFFIYYLLDLFVLSRISFLSGQLMHIDFDKPNSIKIKRLKDGKDEITDLEKSVHNMLESLEKAHSSVTKIAYYDYLTGLPNRFSLYRNFDNRVHENASPFAVLFFDLDGFKRINDLYGHSSGDELLQQVASRLTFIRKSDSEQLYRIGGDEFVFLIECAKPNDIIDIAEVLMEEIRREFTLSAVTTSISSSVGISFYPEDGETLGDLLHFADNAMYEAKNAGKNNYCLYQELKNKEMYKHQLTLKEDLVTAVSKNEFYLEYQPIMDVSGTRICSVEALVRWKHPHYGLISPIEFISLAEESGVIRLLGNWILIEAVKDVGEWNLKNSQSIALAINVSNFQLKYKEELLETIDLVLSETGFSANMLQIEITESDAVVEKEEITEFIRELKIRGIRVALDDFGVGSSSLFQLTNLDIDIVKIDRTFLEKVPENAKDTILLKGIYSILNDLGIEVVTEGIESSQQLEFVASQKTSYLQGFYFSKPVALKNLMDIKVHLTEKV